MKVSVVVPVYNAAEYIEKTAELLLSQTLDDIEIILVNDGSTDASGEICQRLARQNSKIRCVTTENRGVSAARNTGIRLAQGEYIGFCDSDDLPDAELYGTLYNLATKNQCDIAMVKYAKVCNGKTGNGNGDGTVIVYQNKEDVLKDFFRDKLLSGVYTKVFKRELFDCIGFEEGRKINEDKMFIFEAILSSSSWCFKDVSLYTYIRREGSASYADFSDKYLDIIYFAQKMESYIQREYPDLLPLARANTVSGYLQVLKIICKSKDSKTHQNEFKQCADALKKYSISFCKKYLRKNDFYKLLILRANCGLFRLVLRKFADD